MTNVKKSIEEVMLRNYLNYVEDRNIRRKKKEQPTGNLAVMYPEMAGMIQSDEALSDHRLAEIMEQYRRVMSPSTALPAKRRSPYDDETLLDDNY